MKYLLLILCIISLSFPVNADHDLDIYSFEDLFVYDKFGESITRIFNIVTLRDEDELEIVGQISTLADKNVDAYSHYKNYLIVLIWNRIEVFDLSNPKCPIRVKLYQLKEHKSWPGYGRIVKNGNKFYILSTKTTSELIVYDEITNWKIKDIERTNELHEKTLIESSFPPFNYKDSFVVKETDKFLYEIFCRREEVGKYMWSNKKYLRKIRKKDRKVTSELLLGELIETGGD